MSLLKWALIFLVVGIFSSFFGLSHVAAVSEEISEVLFFIFLAIVILFLLFALLSPKKPPKRL